jgi:hypothetical protein
VNGVADAAFGGNPRRGALHASAISDGPQSTRLGRSSTPLRMAAEGQTRPSSDAAPNGCFSGQQRTSKDGNAAPDTSAAHALAETASGRDGIVLRTSGCVVLISRWRGLPQQVTSAQNRLRPATQALAGLAARQVWIMRPASPSAWYSAIGKRSSVSPRRCSIAGYWGLMNLCGFACQSRRSDKVLSSHSVGG